MLAKHNFHNDYYEQRGLAAGVDPLDDLTDSERETLLSWENHFHKKYTHIGDLQ